jgi:hypothetical protein
VVRRIQSWQIAQVRFRGAHSARNSAIESAQAIGNIKPWSSLGDAADRTTELPHERSNGISSGACVRLAIVRTLRLSSQMLTSC